MEEDWIMSFDLGEKFLELYVKGDYNSGVKLVTRAFNQFSKSEDCITKNVLLGLLESAEEEKDQRAILYFSYLLKQLEMLYNSWLLSHV